MYSTRESSLTWRTGVMGSIAAATAVLMLALATSTWANFELTTTFATSGEGALYGSAEGVAVDYATGDVYVADTGGQQVLRYDSHGEFLEAWGLGVANGEDRFQTCGPVFKDGEAEYEHCRGEGGVSGLPATGIAIDQATGNVYVTDDRLPGSSSPVVEEFTQAGEPVAHFAEVEREFKEPVSKTPNLVHAVVSGDIAVDQTSGDVYLIDHVVGAGEFRVMVWKPKSPGDYSEYEYEREVAHEYEDERIAIDSSGDLYVATIEENTIYKFGTGNLTAPTCEIKVAAGGISALATGAGPDEVFAFSYKKRGTFYRVNTCAEPATQLLEAFYEGHEEQQGTSLAFNPDVSLEAGRPTGVVYAVGAEGEHGAHKGLIFAQPPVTPPRVVSESAGGVGVSSATLSAEIDADGYDTRYRFQYGTAGPCAEDPCAEAPIGGADLGASTEDVAAAATIAGLSSGTTYYYRVVASNGYGDTVDGSGQTLTTFPAGLPRLPDERGYELVSPTEKDGGDVFVNGGGEDEPGAFIGAYMPRQSSSDGEAVVYEGAPFAATGEASVNDEYLSTRTASGWQTHDLSPVVTTGAEEGFVAVSTDLSLGVLSESSQWPALAPEAPGGEGDLYLAGTTGGSFTPLLGEPGEPTFRAASSSLSNLVYARGGNLYEWDTADGRSSPVNVLPNGATQTGAVLGSGRELIVPRPEGELNEGADFDNAVSANGSRVYWSDEASGQVYMREDGTRTLGLPDSAKFVTASADGLKVLLDDGYVYELNVGEGDFEAIYSLSEGKGGFQGILGASEDLSTIYFVDTAELTGDKENEYGAHAEPDADNLYYWREGSVTFVATLASTDNESVVGGSSGDWRVSPTNRSAETSPNGRYLAFVSGARLTRFDNESTDGGCGATKSRPCAEVFVYDSVTNHLACASCNPTGVRPLGASTLSSISYSPPIGDYLAQPRYMLNDGRLFFESADALSPYDGGAVGGKSYSVYEYEPAGLGSCNDVFAGEEGCTYLIAPGSEGSSARFLSADTSGENVFFTTRNELVPEDRDDLIDLYDARVHGGFAATSSPSCSGTGCQGSPSAPPIFATPPSATFAGLGNFPAPANEAAKNETPKKTIKCAKGKQLSHGKCVKAKPKNKACAERKGRKGRKCAKAGRAQRAHKSSHRPDGRERR